MRLNSVYPNVVFKRNLTEQELVQYSQTLQKAKEAVGQTGKSIYVMPSTCLPQAKEFNSGIGHISSDIAQDYFKYIKDYCGINTILDLPQGQPKECTGHFFSPYEGTAFSLGNHMINPELLTTDEFEHLLSDKDLEEIASGNTLVKKENFSNFANVSLNSGKHNQVLKEKAYKNFLALPNNSGLKVKYNKYVQENAEWLKIVPKYEDNAEFFKFKQFIADEHLKIGIDKLHKNTGMKFFGDCLIGFSKDEIAAFPNAFLKDSFIGEIDWGLKALNYDEILNESSDANKLLKMKVQLMAKRYDSLRFDVGWAYIKPKITNKPTGNVYAPYKDFGDKLIDNIKNWVKEVKGENFDTKDLIFEVEADGKDFQAWDGGQLISPLRKISKIYGSTYMHKEDKFGWGYNKAYLDRGISPDEFILGIGNHDPQPLRQIANSIKDEASNGEIHKPKAQKVLENIFNLPKNLLDNPIEFAKYKWAEITQSKHNMMFYMDLFGREERFDKQQFNTTVTPTENYAYKVPTDFKKAYQHAINGTNEGFGYNIMDSLEKLFKLKGFDETMPELYQQITYYNKLLQDPKEIIPPPPPPKSKSFKPLILASGAILGIFVAAKFLKNLKNKHKNIEEKNIIQTKAPSEKQSMNDFINNISTKN